MIFSSEEFTKLNKLNELIASIDKVNDSMDLEQYFQRKLITIIKMAGEKLVNCEAEVPLIVTESSANENKTKTNQVILRRDGIRENFGYRDARYQFPDWYNLAKWKTNVYGNGYWRRYMNDAKTNQVTAFTTIDRALSKIISNPPKEVNNVEGVKKLQTVLREFYALPGNLENLHLDEITIERTLSKDIEIIHPDKQDKPFMAHKIKLEVASSSIELCVIDVNNQDDELLNKWGSHQHLVLEKYFYVSEEPFYSIVVSMLKEMEKTIKEKVAQEGKPYHEFCERYGEYLVIAALKR